MTQPKPALPTVELIPLHGAIVTQQPMTLDVLVRITPPAVTLKADRVPLNLSLVIDRSGSMQGQKMHYAREAARFAVENLLPCDRISVVLFDDRLETLVPSTLATDKNTLLEKLSHVHSRGSTALHAGWVEGGVQVSQYLNPAQLNRVIVLSDGLANVGETRPDAIASDVHGLAQRGVSTTTLGIGNDYSEDLLAAMARSGDGNFFHIESADQLPTIFETELSGLAATLGQRVSLGIKPGNGVTVMDVLNDFEQTDTQRYKLPNLMVGSPIQVVVRLQVPALSQSRELMQVRLAWDDAEQLRRQVLRTGLELPLVSSAQFSDFPANSAVQEQVALLMAARARREAIQFSDQGDFASARQSLTDARIAMSSMAPSAMLMEEQAVLEDLEADYQSGNVTSARKKAFSQSFNLSRSGQSKPRRSMDSK
ncbi:MULTISPECIES: VWA domain-containing protein [Cyanophyceae]|uniref:vWA domain-containing protein n=1 Tax=Cyanophyceae TaxID=3028117 RepID=UPI0016835041|nr:MULTISPECIES: VWA domain-containing protein [Cyanophyceae]MBD1918240.1 VWA domain-containing protein [Phormidium sp. FACHB-77]MBD2030272.1 VWA domain-containing protein [Phormidium sp. FACHB-322]MBD2051356.1 VWA domain-containing protein [Leptolyngbya sp. FACHB-60]